MKTTKLLFPLLLVWAVEDVRAQAVEYIHTDALGSPVAFSDPAGNITLRQNYDPYGSSISGNSSDEPGYAGHVEDTALGLIYMQQRYYDPALGIFISIDPVDFLGSNEEVFNLYRYADGNPFRFMDPDGRRARERSTGTMIAGYQGASASRRLVLSVNPGSGFSGDRAAIDSSQRGPYSDGYRYSFLPPDAIPRPPTLPIPSHIEIKSIFTDPTLNFNAFIGEGIGINVQKGIYKAPDLVGGGLITGGKAGFETTVFSIGDYMDHPPPNVNSSGITVGLDLGPAGVQLNFLDHALILNFNLGLSIGAGVKMMDVNSDMSD